MARTRFSLGVFVAAVGLCLSATPQTFGAAQKPNPITLERIRAVAATAADDDMLNISADGTISIITSAEQAALSAATPVALSPAGQGSTSKAQSKSTPASKNGGGPIPQVVIGPENFVSIANTTISPYRMIGLSEFRDANFIGHCTSWLYGNNMIALTAHCFQDGPNAPFLAFTSFWAGYDQPYTPYGSCGLTNLFVPAGWWNYYNQQYDFAAIKLNCSVGNTTGWFNLYNWDGFDTDGRWIYVTGYPEGWSGNTQMYYSHEPPAIQDDYSFYLTYQVDTASGDSGAPVYRLTTDTINGCTNLCVFGIHRGGTILCVPGVSTSGQCNYGRKITTGVYNFLNAARTG